MKSIVAFTLLLTLSFLQSDNFIFTDGKHKIILKIDDNAESLTWNKKSLLNLKLENIDAEKMIMSAQGIRKSKVGNSKNDITLEITPDREVIQNDTLNLRVGFYDEENKYVGHGFAILVKSN